MESEHFNFIRVIFDSFLPIPGHSISQGEYMEILNQINEDARKTKNGQSAK